MLTADYHMHSVSPDARVPMEDMCQAAIDKGLTEVALTDHYEFYAHGIHRKFFHEEYLKMYWDSLERCRERFAGQLTIKSGMEFGQLHLAREEAFNIIRNYPLSPFHRSQKATTATLLNSPPTANMTVWAILI